MRDFADLVRRHAQELGGGEGCGGCEGSSGAEETASCVGIGVNCTDPNHVAGALRTLSAAIAEPSCVRGARSIAGAAAAGATAAAGAAVVATAGVAAATAATVATVATVATAATATASRSGADNTTAAQAKITPTAVGNVAAAPDASNEGKLPQLILVAYPNSGEVWDASARGWVEGTGLRLSLIHI